MPWRLREGNLFAQASQQSWVNTNQASVGWDARLQRKLHQEFSPSGPRATAWGPLLFRGTGTVGVSWGARPCGTGQAVRNTIATIMAKPARSAGEKDVPSQTTELTMATRGSAVPSIAERMGPTRRTPSRNSAYEP